MFVDQLLTTSSALRVSSRRATTGKRDESYRVRVVGPPLLTERRRHPMPHPVRHYHEQLTTDGDLV
jgi:hypothetical protein